MKICVNIRTQNKKIIHHQSSIILSIQTHTPKQCFRKVPSFPNHPQQLILMIRWYQASVTFESRNSLK